MLMRTGTAMNRMALCRRVMCLLVNTLHPVQDILGGTKVVLKNLHL